HRASAGSSVLLPALDSISPSDPLLWEFLDGSGAHPILQRHGGTPVPAILPPYAGRALFHAANGSLLLQHVQESDSGTYRVTVTAGGRRSLEIQLEVLEPVSRPELRTSALLARAPGQLVCEVAGGRMDTITWRKDGQLLSADRVSQEPGSRSILHLSLASKSDCGSYSCNASNGISWQETSLEVTVEGLT
ncbi:HMCN1 protein, partial [Spelaeornis formosus]|nr:HMCN1 protein [Elachura formosa]